MKAMGVEEERIRCAWAGRVSGCILGKPVELISLLQGREALSAYLKQTGALPLRDYIPMSDNPLVRISGRGCCQGEISRAEPDDDLNYTVLALMMLEQHGRNLQTTDVAMAWLRHLPAGATFTAERAAYRTLLQLTGDSAVLGLPYNFNLRPCADNPWCEWIGAQIRADMYGWVCPGQPKLAADLARRDASLSHSGEGVHAAAFIAALGAAIPATASLSEAVDEALAQVPKESAVAVAADFGRSLVGKGDAVDQLHQRYKGLSPVHALNNLALVVWGLLSGENDFSQAVGDTVAAGWDTDCNGATVGGLWGLTGRPIPRKWTEPWRGIVAVNIGGVGELQLADLVARTVKVAQKMKE